MKKLAYFALVLAACGSTPRSEFIDQAVFEDFAVELVREAARIVVEEVAHPRSVVRVTGERVLTEGRIGVCEEHVMCGSGTRYAEQNTGTPWTTIEVRFLDLGVDTAVEVEIEYESRNHCDRWDVGCLPQPLGSTGGLERQIIDRIRARLEDKEAATAK